MVLPVGTTLVYNSTRKGFCVIDALAYLGVHSGLTAWPSLKEILPLYPHVVISESGNVKKDMLFNIPYLVLDLV